jgi:hypothetical protein
MAKPRPTPQPEAPVRPEPQPEPPPAPTRTPALPTTNAPPDTGGAIGVAAAAAAVAGVFGLFLGAAALDKKIKGDRVRARLQPWPEHHLDRLHLRALAVLALDDALCHQPQRPRSFSAEAWQSAWQRPFGGIELLLRLPPNTRGHLAERVQRFANERFGPGALAGELRALPVCKPSTLTGSGGLSAIVEQVVQFGAEQPAALRSGAKDRGTPYLRLVDGQLQLWLGEGRDRWQIIATK